MTTATQPTMSPMGRSRLTNGRLPHGLNGKTKEGRRYRDLLREYEALSDTPIDAMTLTHVRSAICCQIAIERIEGQLLARASLMKVTIEPCGASGGRLKPQD